MEFVKYTAEGPVGVITISRPEALNALNDQVIRQLDAVLSDLDLEQIPQDAVDAYYQTEAPHRMYIGEVIDILYGNESDNASL